MAFIRTGTFSFLWYFAGVHNSLCIGQVAQRSNECPLHCVGRPQTFPGKLWRHCGKISQSRPACTAFSTLQDSCCAASRVCSKSNIISDWKTAGYYKTAFQQKSYLLEGQRWKFHLFAATFQRCWLCHPFCGKDLSSR